MGPPPVVEEGIPPIPQIGDPDETVRFVINAAINSDDEVEPFSGEIWGHREVEAEEVDDSEPVFPHVEGARVPSPARHGEAPVPVEGQAQEILVARTTAAARQTTSSGLATGGHYGSRRERTDDEIRLNRHRFPIIPPAAVPTQRTTQARVSGAGSTRPTRRNEPEIELDQFGLPMAPTTYEVTTYLVYQMTLLS